VKRLGKPKIRPPVIAAFVIAALLGAAAPDAPPNGDWAGWMYLDGDVDAPLRVRIGEDRGAPTVRFDELTRRQYDLPATISVWSPPRIVIERKRPNGQLLHFDGRVDGDAISGSVDWAGRRGRFEMVRSGEPISRLRPEDFADLAGTYSLDRDRTLLVSARPWGELVYTDLGTGRQGALFPIDRDRFFAGGGMYVPRPVEATVTFRRGADDAVSRVEWAAAGNGEMLQGTRCRFAEEDVRFGDSVAGTLLRPAGSGGRIPAVVVLGGSDWAIRSGARRDAEIFASYGLAALIFDRRGNGATPGNPIHPFAVDADDALAAVRYLKTRPDILPNAVGVTGRSQGGWLAPLAASKGREADFVVIFVPPAISPFAQEKNRRNNELADRGYDAAARDQEAAYLDLAVRYAETRKDWERYRAAREAAKAKGFPDDVLESDRKDDPEWEWGRANWLYDPVPALERVKVPMLAVFGGADRNVDPAVNAPIMRAAFERAGNRDATILVVPGANHALNVLAKADVPYHRQTGFGNQGWPDVARWLRTHLPISEPRVAKP